MKTKHIAEQALAYQHQRGVIKDKAIMALLHDPLFRQRVEKKRKGKGSYQRKAKHISKFFEKPDYKIFSLRDFIIGFFLIVKNKNSNEVCYVG